MALSRFCRFTISQNQDFFFPLLHDEKISKIESGNAFPENSMHENILREVDHLHGVCPCCNSPRDGQRPSDPPFQTTHKRTIFQKRECFNKVETWYRTPFWWRLTPPILWANPLIWWLSWGKPTLIWILKAFIGDILCKRKFPEILLRLPTICI